LHTLSQKRATLLSQDSVRMRPRCNKIFKKLLYREFPAKCKNGKKMKIGQYLAKICWFVFDLRRACHATSPTLSNTPIFVCVCVCVLCGDLYFCVCCWFMLYFWNITVYVKWAVVSAVLPFLTYRTQYSVSLCVYVYRILRWLCC